MKTKIALTILTAAALLCGCRQKWEYTSFKYIGYHDLDQSNAEMSEILINGHLGANGIMIWEQTNLVATFDDTLNEFGQYGWRLVWTDGSNCIVERPTGFWKGGKFAVAPAIVPRVP